MLVTAFRSPATAARFRGLHSGVKVPGLPLRFPASRLPLPVRPFGSATRSGSPRFRPLRCLRPVAVSTARSTDCASSLHSPSGLLPPSGSKRSAGFAACRPAFRIRPISSRSPQPFSISSVSAADHRSWSATFPEACCSSNLLEPLPLCSRTAFLVNAFCVLNAHFPQHLSAFVSNWLQGYAGAFAVDKPIA